MEEQVQQFATVRGNITDLLRSPKAVNDVLQDATYILSIGNNDVIEYAATFKKTPPDPIHFIANLTQAYAAHLVNMYELGARKFAIVGIPPIGCAPASRVFNTTGGCINVENDIVRLFYTSMQSLLTGFSLKLKGFKYSLGNSYALTMNVIDNPLANAQYLIVFAIYVVANGIMMMTVGAATDAPIFIFGDSTADVGTNNHLKGCKATADHRYNGIDFPFSKPTGRFSNGKNAADQIARLLGNYKLSPPPFLSLLADKPRFNSRLLRGANFASGGAGVYTETGQVVFSLYDLGARKFAIVGIPPIGCAPAPRAYNETGGCIDILNDGARLFYTSMQSLLTGLSLKLKGFKYSLGNTYAMTMNVIDNPRGNRFKEVKVSCCGNGTTDCVLGVNLCVNRGDFLFWDKFHPTEKASELAALTLVYGEGSEYARRAYKALRSLVKLQAVVRGAYVRRQSRIALECMHALARLQVVVRARELQLFTSNISYSSPAV
ncbi:hypothetical protein SSX86_014758 [Deinandra increscens subsp. villosa]|uniref:GDSL esterase/lipase n=1 Tax=Deinandra increscens subsp. villosa TaxID=3103831 RepID=A0AAP0D2T8_9ASTR